MDPVKLIIEAVDQTAPQLASISNQVEAAERIVKRMSDEIGTTADQYKRMVQEVEKYGDGLDGIGEQAEGIHGNFAAVNRDLIQLAKLLGQSYGEAEKLSAELGLSGDQISNAIAQIKTFNGVNISQAQQFQTLNKELGLTEAQFKRIAEVAKPVPVPQKPTSTPPAPPPPVIDQATMASARTLGKSYTEAEQLSKELGVSSEKITRAYQQMQQFNAVKIPQAQQFQALSKELGITEKQFEELNKAFKKTSDTSEKTQQQQFPYLGKWGDKVAGISFAFNQVTAAIGVMRQVGGQAYGLLIGQNEQLNQQILQASANLVATNKIIQNGIEVTDPKAAIAALKGPISDALKQVQKDSMDLVGITSGQLTDTFQILTSQASALANQSAKLPGSIDAASKLTTDFAAAIGAIGLPLSAARQEIVSITSAQIDSNSSLAKNLGITSDMVRQWKAQGVLVDKLREKLNPFVAANALAARSVTGISSNMKDLLEVTTRVAGEPLLEVLVDGLDVVYQFLKSKQGEVQEFLSVAVQGVSDVFRVIGDSVGQLAEHFGDEIMALIGSAAQLLVSTFKGVAIVLAEAVKALILFDKAVPIVSKSLQYLADKAQQVADGYEKIYNFMNLVSGRQGDSDEAVAGYQEQANQQFATALKIYGDTEKRLDALQEKKKKGIKLTAEEQKEESVLNAKRAAAASGLRSLSEELDTANVVGQENQAIVNGMKMETTAWLGKLGGTELASKDLQKLGTTFEQLEKGVKAAQDAMKTNSNGNQDQYKADAKKLIDFTNQQLQLGRITADEAEARLQALTTDTALSLDIQQSALKTIGDARKKDGDEEVARLKAQGAEVQAALDVGTKSQALAAEELTAIKKKELDRQLADVQTALKREVDGGRGKGDVADQLRNQEKQLQADLLKNKQEGVKQQRAEDLKNFDEGQQLLQADRDRRIVGERIFNEDSLAITRDRTAEEIKQLEEDLAKLAETDIEGREAISVKIAAAEAKLANAEEDFREKNRQLKLEDYDEQQEDLEAVYANRLAGEVEYNQKSIELTRQRVAEELRQIEEKKGDLSADDVDGRQRLEAQADAARARLGKAEQEWEQQQRDVKLANFDEDQQFLEAAYAKRIVKEGEYNAQSLEITVKKGEEELRQLAEQQSKLAASDIEGREKIAAQMAEVEGRIAKAQEEFDQKEQARKLKLFEQAQKRAMDAIEQSAIEREIQMQKLVNDGTIRESETAGEKLKIARTSMEAELALEREKLATLEALPKLSDPDAEEDRQSKIRDSRKQTSQITLSLLKNEREQQQELEAAIARGIDRRLKALQNTLTAEQLSAERAQQRQDLLSQSLQNQNKLLEARKDLAQSLNSYVQGQLDILTQVTKGAKDQQRLAETKAAIELKALNQKQALEKESLLLQLQQNEAAREREKIQFRIQQVQAQADLATKQAERAKVYSRKDSTAEDKVAADLGVQAAIQKSEGLQQTMALAEESANIDRRVDAGKMGKLEREQATEYDQKELAFAQSLKGKKRRRAEKQIERETRRDLFGTSDRGAVRAGMDGFSNQTAREAFGGRFGVANPMQQQYAGMIGRALLPVLPAAPVAGGLQQQMTQPVPSKNQGSPDVVAAIGEFGQQLQQQMAKAGMVIEVKNDTTNYFTTDQVNQGKVAKEAEQQHINVGYKMAKRYEQLFKD